MEGVSARLRGFRATLKKNGGVEIRGRGQLFVVFLCLTTFIHLCNAIIYGWASLAPLLYYFYEGGSCSASETSETAQSESCGIPQLSLRVNLVFTVATFTSMASTLPAGILLDKIGASDFCPIFGNTYKKPLLYGQKINPPAVWALVIGYSLMGFGGNVMGLSFFSRACLFHGRLQPTVVSIWVASCNSGPLVFFWFSLIVKATGVSLSFIFLGYLIVPLFVLVFIILWPKQSENHTKANNVELQVQAANLLDKSGDPDGSTPDTKVSKGYTLIDCSLRELFSSKQFITITVALSLNTLFFSSFISTLGMRIELLDSQYQSLSLTLWGIIFPSLQVALALPVGWYNNSFLFQGFCGSFIVSVSFSLMCFSIEQVDTIAILIAVFVLFSVWRTLFWSSIGAIFFKWFGYKNYGMLNAVLNTIVGAVTCAQYGLATMVARSNNGFLSYDCIQLVVFLGLLIIPVICIHWRRKSQIP